MKNKIKYWREKKIDKKLQKNTDKQFAGRKIEGKKFVATIITTAQRQRGGNFHATKIVNLWTKQRERERFGIEF